MTNDIDTIALDVARRFTLDTEPQRRASLQVAIIEAIKEAAPSPPADAATPPTDGLVAIINDLRHSARVDDYELPQIAFIESIAKRLTAVAADALAQQPAAKAAAPAPGVGDAVALPRDILTALYERDGGKACGCINLSRKAELEYESGQCPHQRLAQYLAAPPAPQGALDVIRKIADLDDSRWGEMTCGEGHSDAIWECRNYLAAIAAQAGNGGGA
ncbi:hypothetical protein [Pseudoxanthomonas winnipegensis]|uniref:hypothetical protein n=1 Tax=Pseudoxanthomonas winnipegensis TaxID=2480810 RepID=UPI00102DE001|nr:hypothetical protein [Pseudoxanthomonas winnipegensis]RZZ90648.1 hypothetical protein EA663_02525 [Pseudoxanthomonas winnipegensis]